MQLADGTRPRDRQFRCSSFGIRRKCHFRKNVTTSIDETLYALYQAELRPRYIR